MIKYFGRTPVREVATHLPWADGTIKSVIV